MLRTGLTCLVALLSVLRPPNARAQDLMLDEEPVHAAAVEKVAVAPDVRPHSATVMTGEELSRRGFRTLGDALAFVVGMNVDRTTAGEVFSQRGIPNGMSLVMDGVPQVLDGERASLDVADINLADVERVEVVRGPVTAVNGVGPLSGVVNVITRKPGLTGAGVRVGVTDLGERSVHADGTWRKEELAARVSLSYRAGTSARWRLEAVPTRYIQVGSATLFSTKVNTTRAVDDEQWAGRLAASYRGVLVDGWFTRSQQFSPLSRFSHADVSRDPQERFRQQQRLRVMWQGFLGPVAVQAAAYASQQNRRDRIPLFPRGGPFPSGGETTIAAQVTTAGALLRADIPLGPDRRLVLGSFGDVTRNNAQSDSVDPVTGAYTPALVTLNTLTGTLSGAAEYQWDMGLGFHVNAGLVGEWRTAYGFSLAPRASLQWNPLPFFTARLAYSEGTRSPDRYDVTSLTQAVVAARVVGAGTNPRLRPERVRSLEVGASFDPSAQLHVGADLFVSRHEDAVVNAVDGLHWVPGNQSARLITGGEVISTCDVIPGWLHAWAGGAVSAVVDGPALQDNVGSVLFGTELTPLPGLELGTRSRLRHRMGNGAGSGPAHTTDLFSSYEPPGGRFTVMGGVRNVFNQNPRSHEEAGLTNAPDVAVPSPTRTFYVAVEGRL
jgi:outer membrane receptor protein involved in Fe transport